MSRDDKKKPQPLGDLMSTFLRDKGLEERVQQALVIPEWVSLVGPQIAAVAEPKSIAANGLLFVWVKSNAWMNELSLMKPELLRAINKVPGRPHVRDIRLLLRRDD